MSMVDQVEATGSHTYATHDVVVAGGRLRVGVWEPTAPVATGPDGTPLPAVVLVHGITASHRAWPAIAAALPGRRVIAPDLRGRGRSNGLPGPYGMAAHADDVAAVVRALAEGPAVVVGHSMGGFVSLVLTHRHPDLVERLVLVDGGLPIPLPPGVPDGATPEELVRALLGPAIERLTQTFPSAEAYREFWRAHPPSRSGTPWWSSTWTTTWRSTRQGMVWWAGPCSGRRRRPTPSPRTRPTPHEATPCPPRSRGPPRPACRSRSCAPRVDCSTSPAACTRPGLSPSGRSGSPG